MTKDENKPEDLQFEKDILDHEVLARKIKQASSVFIQGGNSTEKEVDSFAATLISNKSDKSLFVFDQVMGRLRCSGAFTVEEVNKRIIEKGWLLPVAPSTKRATIGGIVASDASGSNFEKYGTIGSHVISLKIINGNGDLVVAHKESDPDLLKATIGGLGLTGFIYEVEFDLKPCSGVWMNTQDLVFNSFSEYIKLHIDSADWEHKSAWVAYTNDFRGVFTRSRHAEIDVSASRQIQNKINLPKIALLDWTLVSIYRHIQFSSKSKNSKVKTRHYQDCIYQNDLIHDWARSLFPCGIAFFQVVIPIPNAKKAIESIFFKLTKNKVKHISNTLTIMSDKERPGNLSFSRSGVCLTLTLPASLNESVIQDITDSVLISGGTVNPSGIYQLTDDQFIKAHRDVIAEISTHRDAKFQNHFSEKFEHIFISNKG